MNDRYLFRAKRIDNGEWVQGYYTYYPCGFTSVDKVEHAIRDTVPEYYSKLYFVDPSTICQCTGLKDKNGTLIWENDIIKCGEYITRVSWNKKYASWVITKSGWLYHHFFGESQNPEDCEVIGNIFDNPDLLEQEG